MEEMQNEVDEDIKGVDSRDTVKRNEKSDQWNGQLSKLPILLVGFAHPSYTWFLGPTPLSPPPKNGISIGSAVFAGLRNVTNTQTYKPRYCVCSSRPLPLALAAMHCLRPVHIDATQLKRTEQISSIQVVHSIQP